MKYLNNEKGSSLFYLLWIMTTTIVIFLIVVNITRVYVVKQTASTAAQLAAFAATRELLIATEEAIVAFDNLPKVVVPEEGEVTIVIEDPLGKVINDRKTELKDGGMSEEKAYIKALNEILPGRLSDSELMEIFEGKFKNIELSSNVYGTVQRVIKENGGNEEHVEIKISKDKYRVEVKTDATYETITDGSLFSSFTQDIPQIGYGLPLSFLKYVLN